MLPFDELNRLEKSKGRPRSMNIDKFFDEMILPERSRADRKEFAKNLENELFVILAFIYYLIDTGHLEQLPRAKELTENIVTKLISEYTYPSMEMTDYIRRYADEFVEVTVRQVESHESDKDKAYWFSEDRAKLNAENEANTLFNLDEFTQAVADGYTRKRWITMKDERVRPTHAAVDGVTIPINDRFVVGESLMRFPKDPDVFDPEEVIGCRCTIMYLKK